MAITSPQRNLLLSCLITTILSGCAATEQKYQLEPSYLKEETVKSPVEQLTEQTTESEAATAIKRLTAMDRKDVDLGKSKNLENAFSDQASLSVAVNSMTLKSFLHYAFGEMLKVDYVLGKNVTDSDNITLNVSHSISPRRLFTLSEQLLLERGMGINFKDGIYYIYQLPSEGKANVIMGFGRNAEEVPNNSGQILQIVPLKYGIRISVERTLRGLVDADITADFEQGALFIRGRRDQIVRALDLIKLLDVPSNRGKHIALISPTYLSTTNFIQTVTQLLQTEGFDVGKTANKTENLVFVPLNQLGSVAVFSAEEELLERVEYWAEQIDKPSKGTERKYHLYTPRFARASDLAESLAPLISGVTTSGASTPSAKDQKGSSNITANQASQQGQVSSNEKLSMVVDKRSNMLIFNASGSEYQSILPLVRRMDVMPKQILLSVTIAEVTLTGVFKRGFEWAVTSGNFKANTTGGFGDLAKIGGVSLDWLSGSNSVSARFIDDNSQVNVLSKPSLLVRDGTEANISVGEKLPITSSETTGTGDFVTTSTSYRETGIKLTVTPTVNSQGVVIMKIMQEISNEVEQTGTPENPTFFDRSISTEVVADSGQTILLGGLISDNSSDSDKGVPFLKSIPLLGALFEHETKSNTKTELVILMTPKIIERSNQWQSILNKFENGLDNINLQ